MRVADFVTKRLVHLGVDTTFLVTGGGAMYLNDAIGANQSLKKVYCHHEQGASIAAEAYARVALKPALLNVTTGPGGINALNGVFGAFTDSIPMVVVSGQVKRETMLEFNPVPGLRQLGDQEVNIVEMAKPVTKWAKLLRNPEDIVQAIDQAYIEAVSGRPGPVWLDIPVDIQGAALPADYEKNVTRPLAIPGQGISNLSDSEFDSIVEEIAQAKRPVIFAGSGIRIAGMDQKLLELAERLQIPVVTAWTHDTFPNEHPLFAGRPGTIGTRAGNFVVQSSDLVLILGSRLNIRQVSYNYKSFAKNAKKIWVDIDPAEFKKPFVSADVTLVDDLKSFLPALIASVERKAWNPSHKKWVVWCQGIYQRYSPKSSDYPESADAINSYHFIEELFSHLKSGDVVVCGDATATIVPYQIGRIKQGMQLISNSGCASMGYDIPGALGAATAKPDARVICLAGDGSAMMNIQELQTIAGLGLNVLVFILNNDGYLSIKQTQRNFFGREAGSSTASGLTFPDFEQVGKAFGFSSVTIGKDVWQEKLANFMEGSGAKLCNVSLDLIQEFEPRLKSKMIDGVITTPELDDMYPFLDPNELNKVRESALNLH